MHGRQYRGSPRCAARTPGPRDGRGPALVEARRPRYTGGESTKELRMGRTGQYCEQLEPLLAGRQQVPELELFLVAHSGLPGPRGNLDLAEAFVRSVTKAPMLAAWLQTLYTWAAITADQAPTGDPREFLALRRGRFRLPVPHPPLRLPLLGGLRLPVLAGAARVPGGGDPVGGRGPSLAPAGGRRHGTPAPRGGRPRGAAADPGGLAQGLLTDGAPRCAGRPGPPAPARHPEPSPLRPAGRRRRTEEDRRAAGGWAQGREFPRAGQRLELRAERVRRRPAPGKTGPAGPLGRLRGPGGPAHRGGQSEQEPDQAGERAARARST